MNRDIPEIDELLDGINASGPTTDTAQPDTTEADAHKDKAGTPAAPVAADGTTDAMERCWQELLDTLQDDTIPKDRTAYCMIDRDLADTLDECRIHGNCRTGLVNAILRVFIKTFLDKLAGYRRESSSFFQPPKST